MWWKVDIIQQLTTASSVRRNSKESQTCSKLPPKKAHDHCLVVCCCWSEPLQLSESHWNHYIWEVCSADWQDAPKTATPIAGISQQNGPSSSPWQCLTPCHTTNTSKIEWIWVWIFASSSVFTWPLIIELPLLQASQYLLQGKCFHNQQDAERISWILKYGFLCYRKKHTYFSLAKRCWV